MDNNNKVLDEKITVGTIGAFVVMALIAAAVFAMIYFQMGA